jgi:hypothetical protein
MSKLPAKDRPQKYWYRFRKKQPKAPIEAGQTE